MSDPVPPGPSELAAGGRPAQTARALGGVLWLWCAIVAVLGATAYQLHRQGRLWRCSCGPPYLWTGEAWSSLNSQLPFDPYSFTHVLHGIVLCGLLAWVAPRLSPAWRLVLAVSLEGAWEVVENSGLIIERYRKATIALGYQGDTILNSLGDMLSCGIGFSLARSLGARGSVVLFVAIEVLLVFWIRDNLILNLIMLIRPIDSIKAWQVGH